MRKTKRFSSNKILENKDVSSNKMISKIQFTKETKKDITPKLNKEFSIRDAYETPVVMRNLFTKKAAKLQPKQAQKQPSQVFKSKSNQRSSALIAKEINERINNGEFDSLLNASISQNNKGFQSSLLGKSIINITLNNKSMYTSENRLRNSLVFDDVRHSIKFPEPSGSGFLQSSPEKSYEGHKLKNSIIELLAPFEEKNYKEYTSPQKENNEEDNVISASPITRTKRGKDETKVEVINLNLAQENNFEKEISTVKEKTHEAHKAEVVKKQGEVKRLDHTDHGSHILDDKLEKQPVDPKSLQNKPTEESKPTRMPSNKNKADQQSVVSNSIKILDKPTSKETVDCDFDEELNTSDHLSHRVYATNKNVTMEEVNLLNEISIPKEESNQQYKELISKFMFSRTNLYSRSNSFNAEGSLDQELNNNDYNSLNISVSNSNYLNESRISQIEKDLDFIISNRRSMTKVNQYYISKLNKMERALRKMKESKQKEIENIKDIKLHETSLIKDIINNDENPIDNEAKSAIKKVKSELETLKLNLKDKENNYKIIIRSLLNELNTRSRMQISDNNTSILGDDSIMKEINDLLQSVSGKTRKSISTEEDNRVSPRKLAKGAEQNNEDSIILDLREFQEDDIANYNFEVPLKYQMSRSTKLQKEEKRTDGKAVRYYENSVVEIISRNKNITRLFPDGYTITFFSNKDIKQCYPNGRTVLFYSKNRSVEFNYPDEGFIAYLFKNLQFEKHYMDGRKCIKFTDGTIKIIRPNGEEINLFKDNRIQRKDKNGVITTTEIPIVNKIN